MARKNTSNLDNQISLMDMMVSENTDYIEERPKENQEISENVKNDINAAAQITGSSIVFYNSQRV